MKNRHTWSSWKDSRAPTWDSNRSMRLSSPWCIRPSPALCRRGRGSRSRCSCRTPRSGGARTKRRKSLDEGTKSVVCVLLDDIVQHVRQIIGLFTLCFGPIRCRTYGMYVLYVLYVHALGHTWSDYNPSPVPEPIEWCAALLTQEKISLQSPKKFPTLVMIWFFSVHQHQWFFISRHFDINFFHVF